MKVRRRGAGPTRADPAASTKSMAPGEPTRLTRRRIGTR
jgi:hypothetical protein